MRDFKEFIKPALSLFIICLVAAVALSVTNHFTKGPIAKKQEAAESKARAAVMPADSYKENTIKYDGKEYKYYTANKDKNIIGYIFTTQSAGYKGDIKVVTAINVDGSVHAVQVIDASNETAGIGQKVVEKSFTDRFVSNKAPFTAGDNIDAISGATISSKATIKAVNIANELYKIATGGGKGE